MTTTTITAVTPDLDTLDYTYDPSPFHNKVARLHPDGTLTVRYAHTDIEPVDVDDLLDGWSAQWVEFNSEVARDEFVAEQRRNKVAPSRIFVVDHHDHGMSDFTVAYQMTHPIKNYRPADRWDTRPSVVLVVSDTTPVKSRSRHADAVCQRMSDVTNGDVYGVTTDRYTRDTDGGWELDIFAEATWWGIPDCDVDATLNE